MNPSKNDIDARVLCQLLAAQSAFSVFTAPQKMGEFVCRAVEGVPGVASCAACLPDAERPRLGGEPVPECADCDVPEGDIDHDPGHRCRLPRRAGIQIFPIKTQDRHFGFLLLKLEGRERYTPYEPFVSNLTNGLAVNIEHRWQKDRLEAATVELRRHRDHLEELVRERTAELEEDITKRERAEDDLRDSEARYRALFQGTADGILIADLESRMFRYANPTICRLLGYSEAELQTMSVADIHPKADLPAVMAEFEAQARGDKTMAVGLPCLRKDGTIVYADVNAGAMTIDGRVCNVGFFRDITWRVRTEEARRQAEENFRRSMDESPLGIRIVSPQGETLYANRAILDIYGYKDIEELKSTPVKNRYTQESYAEYQLRKKKRMNGEDYASEYEISIIRKTGEIRHLWVFRKEVIWNGKKQFQAIYQDSTEQKKTADHLQNTLGSLRSALGGIIQVLSATTEKRDPYTAGHQRRVADLARAIGQEMGLAADREEGLRLGGTIHDIGKVAIPAEILSKPTRLTDIEFKLIQSHSQVGYDILHDIDFSWPLGEMVLQHHERMNGSGYPQGLKGEDILLEARILAVSDIVEAMASHRPYRPALGIAAALEEIEKNKGTLYDPDVVSACLTLFREKGFTLK